jgi:hypothetical protein
MFHPEVLTTNLFTLLKHNHAGVTMDVETLSEREGNYYAIGGFVQSFDGFGALLYRIVDDLPALLDSPEFYGDVERRIASNLDAIREHGCIGAWYADGELFIDVVEAWDCLHNAGVTDEEFSARGRTAVAQGHVNKQDAIGHVCIGVQGNYESLYLNKAGV